VGPQLRRTFALLLLSISWLPARALAERQHTVSEGQTLGSIAQSYRVSVASLAAANARGPNATLRVGEVLSVPESGVVVLGEGESLWSVARRNDVTVQALAQANGLAVGATLQPGTRLKLPGAPKGKQEPVGKSVPATKAKVAASEPVPVSVKSGTVSLLRVATNERLKITLTDARGRVRPQAAARMASFLKPRGSKKQKRPELRLLGLIAEVSKHYQGKVIQVMSGYRVAKGYTSKESRHTKGAAMDIRIDGVANRALCDYLRHFKNVGVGYYPNSLFVHFDVRDKNAYWIDLSSPGRKPSYLDSEQREHFDGKNKDEGLVELGKSVADAVGGELELEDENEGE
jgi:uncharacterized protein YcbK (DUF882 family)